MLPPPVPTFASAGIVVSALFGRREAKPSTLIWPPAGVSNSMVPRLFAVTGNPDRIRQYERRVAVARQ